MPVPFPVFHQLPIAVYQAAGDVGGFEHLRTVLYPHAFDGIVCRPQSRRIYKPVQLAVDNRAFFDVIARKIAQHMADGPLRALKMRSDGSALALAQAPSQPGKPPGINLVTFGHVGDGNLHYNPQAPDDWTKEAYVGERANINRIVHDIVIRHGGSISAEHGVGRLRLDENMHYKSPVEIGLMRTIKKALDPQNIMNPGKVIRL